MLRSLLSSSSSSSSTKSNLLKFLIPATFRSPQIPTASPRRRTTPPIRPSRSFSFDSRPACTDRSDSSHAGGGSRGFCSAGADRESLSYDVVIVGAGPAGLSAAIRLKQLCRERDTDISVCVVEKGAEVGAHILSGNVFEPRALDELLPSWRQEGAPVEVPVSSDKFWLLTRDRALSLPSPFENKGNYVISLSQLVRWMAFKAEELGVEIYPGFPASEITRLLVLELMIWALLKMVPKGKLFNVVLS